jgi:hypothetical protein
MLQRTKPRISERERQEIIRGLGCTVQPCWHTPIDLHHVRTAANSGTGMKPDNSFLVALCRFHHREGDRIGWKTFEKRYGVDLAQTAKLNAQIDRPMP